MSKKKKVLHDIFYTHEASGVYWYVQMRSHASTWEGCIVPWYDVSRQNLWFYFIRSTFDQKKTSAEMNFPLFIMEKKLQTRATFESAP